MNVILASESPNKKDVLQRAGLKFTAKASGYKEDMTLDMQPDQLAEHLARGKAVAVAAKNPEAIVIGTDVFVEYDGNVYGKPSNEAEARTTLQLFKGKTVNLVCGLAVIKGKDIRSTVKEATVTFRDDITSKEIDAYIKTGEPLQSGGSFMQGKQGVNLIEHAGDHSTIIGLPIYTTLKILREMGVNPLCQQ